MIDDNPIPDSFSIRVVALHKDGSQDVFEFDDYGLLRELLNDVEEEAEKRGWFTEPPTEGITK